MPRKRRQSSQPSGSREEEDMAACYPSPTRPSSPIRFPSLVTETTQVPQNMELCLILKWMTDRDNAAFIEREEETARQRVEREQQRQEDSVRFEALLARPANISLTPPSPTSPRTGTAPGLTPSGVALTTSATSSTPKTAVHPPPLLAPDVTFQNFREWRRRWKDYATMVDLGSLPSSSPSKLS